MIGGRLSADPLGLAGTVPPGAVRFRASGSPPTTALESVRPDARVSPVFPVASRAASARVAIATGEGGEPPGS